MDIVFFGTPTFVIPILEKLVFVGGYHLSAVVTAPDKPVGRHQILNPSPVKAWASQNNIPVIDSDSMIQIIEKIQKFKPQLGILAAYGKILPPNLINLFPKGILAIHPSLLPKYRGASPIPAAILAGERETGVTIFKMDEKVDHGPIIAQFKEEIKPEETAAILLEHLFSQAAKVLVTILPAYLEGRIEPRQQDHSQAIYTKILKKREGGYIDLNNPPSPEVFNRMVRAYHPWPGVWTQIKLKPPTRSVLVQGRTLQGKIIKFLPGQKLQVEGGKPMSHRDFLNGYPETKTWLSKIYPDLS